MSDSEVKVRERPILFSAPMVRALIDGRKTQTRRIVSARNCDCDMSAWNRLVWNDAAAPVARLPAVVPDGSWHGPGNGYAKVLMRPHDADDQADEGLWTRHRILSRWLVGDLLWVRESFRFGVEWDDDRPIDVDPQMWSEERPHVGIVHFEADGPPTEGFGRLRSSLHMPRWASRLTLEVLSVKCERVQDITEADAIAEGFEKREHFIRLWGEINGPGSFDANPWVWVIGFKVLQKGRG